MKNQFSTHWNSSVQPRKQRKYRFNAPLHVKSTFLASNLAKDLRSKYGTRSLRVRVGDTVKLMRGQFSGRSGKVERVDTIRTRVFITGIDQPKRDGTKKLYPVNPSNLMITSLVDDKRRFPVKDAAPKVKQPKAAQAQPKAAPVTVAKAKQPAKAPAAKAKVKA